MVIVDPWNPITPQPWYPDPQPTIINPTITYERIKEVEKKWRERHIKDVKKGILITFEGDEQPLFIATDDKCWDKIMDAIKDEPKKDNK